MKMAQAKAFKFGKSMILLGDGADPEIFSAPCGFDNLTMSVQIASNDVAIPDCDDPDFPAWLVTDIVSKQMRLTGSGLLDTDAMQRWQEWWFGDVTEKNVRWFRDLTSGQGGGYFQAPAVLTTYEETAQRGQRWQVNIAINLNGKPTFTAA